MEIDIDTICRICLNHNQDEELKSIHKVGMICGELVKLADMLTVLTSVEFVPEENWPSSICRKCLMQLSKAYMFYKKVLKSTEILNEKKVIFLKAEEDVEAEASEHISNEYDQQIIVESYNELEDHLQPDEQNSQPEQEEQIEIDKTSLNEQEYKNEYHVVEITTCDPNSYEIDDVYIETEEEVSSKQKTKRFRSKGLIAMSLTCSICNKTLSNPSSYKYHMQLHSDETPFLCSECGEKFKTKNAYDGHMMTHNATNPNTCNICGKTYRHPSSLKSHILSHTGEKPFLCIICGKGMTQKSGYKKHMLTHTGEKPFSCDVCDKQFRYSSNLITHKRVHTGEKPYGCQICDKRFVGSEQLKRHSLIHTGEKPFECAACGKAFNRKSSLIAHEQTHSSVKNQYDCNVCAQSFSSLHILNNHMSIHKQ